MITFDTVESEADYLAWLAAHPAGFVVNTTRPNPTGSYFVLHRTSCWHISGEPNGDGRWTGRAYQKLCSDSRPELEAMARSLGGEATDQCLCWAKTTVA